MQEGCLSDNYICTLPCPLLSHCDIAGSSIAVGAGCLHVLVHAKQPTLTHYTHHVQSHHQGQARWPLSAYVEILAFSSCMMFYIQQLCSKLHLTAT